MYSINVSTHFDAAHFLSGHPGRCRNIHGHRWEVVVSLSSALKVGGDSDGMVIDFSEAKKGLESVVERFDHTLIFETGSLSAPLYDALIADNYELSEVAFRPTAEHLAGFFYKALSQVYGDTAHVIAVTVYETPESSATYTED
ncbi:MAG: 6-carboxytetrahydropterin synthase QueD [Ruminococcus sp.]|jgi:6-pyruvoyltetrahydropterin/6-carboxytetrahydropterin synthase|nr:6-carboxytetrahydropterin synthase QueD [Ruminococcus sp.]